MNKVCLLILTLLFYYPACGQQTAYDITINFTGYNDSIAYLGNYFGDKMAITDTTLAHDGTIVFKGNEPLKQGVYFLVTEDKKKAFEFLVGDDQYFSIDKEMPATPEQAKFTGSQENEIFYKYLDYNSSSYNKVKDIRAQMQMLPEGSDSLQILQAELEHINEEGIAYKLDLIAKYPETIIALLFSAMREPEVPDFFLPDGRHDSLAAYLYYRDHYWDYVDISDDRYLRTPVFHRKLERYMNQLIPAHPDSLIMEIDKMIARTSRNSEMENYLLWYFTNTYETSKVMGYDKIFVHMVDTYFTGQGYDWLHPTVQQNLIKRVDQLRNVLIGSFAPLLVMADTAEKFISLHQLEAEYIIILFWSSTCGECRHEVSSIDNYLKSSDIDIKVYAVNTDTSFSAWKEFISEHQLDWVNVNGNMSLTGDYHQLYDIYSTPVIYLLDDQRTIIAKRIQADQLPAVIDRHRNNKKTKLN